jgi:3',5'-cyclic-AMP phosphodiesterase
MQRPIVVAGDGRPARRGPPQSKELRLRSYLVVQISDVHLTADGTLPPGVRPRDNLVRALEVLDSSDMRPDVILLTGDLTNSGDPACYDDLRATVAGSSKAAEAGLVYLPGNHDERGAFRRHLLDLDGHAPVNQTYRRDGLRVIALDSVVPGQDHGVLAEEALDYLRAELATPAPDGTILALHHPPIPSPIKPMAGIALQDPARLRDVIEGSDIRLIVAGHSHHEGLGVLGTTPVWVSPAIAYRLDTTSTGAYRGYPGSAFSRIDLTADGPVVTVVQVALSIVRRGDPAASSTLPRRSRVTPYCSTIGQFCAGQDR